MNRSTLLIELRPTLDIAVNAEDGPVEIFMHQTLRPILKFQNDWILMLVKKAPHFNQLKFQESDEQGNRSTLHSFILKNKNIRFQLLGGIIGLLTTEELEQYFLNRNELNKRIMQMIVTRIVSQLFKR